MALVLAFGALASSASAAEVTWDGGAGTSSWQDANNWNTDQVPTPDDDAIVAGAMVDVNADTSVKSLTLGGMSGRIFVRNNSTLTLGDGESLIAHELATNGTGHFQFNGTTTFAGSDGSLSLNDTSTATNSLGATLNLANGGRIGGIGVFTNEGALISVDGNTGVNTHMVSSGSVQVVAGKFRPLSVSSTGPWSVGLAAVLDFAQGTFALNASSSLTGAGTLQLEGTVFGAPTATVAEMATFDIGTIQIDAGRLNLRPATPKAGRVRGAGGIIDATGAMTVGPDAAAGGSELKNHRFLNTGTVEFAAGDPVTIAGGSTQANNGMTLRFAGTTTLNLAGDFFAGDGALIHNAANAEMTVTNTAGNWSGTGTFRNSGSLVHEGAARLYGMPFDNRGSVTVEENQFVLRGLLNTSTGSWSIADLARLTFQQGSFSLPSGSSVSGAGVVGLESTVGGSPVVSVAAGATFNPARVEVATGTLNFDGTHALPNLTHSGGTVGGAGTVTVNALTWTGGNQMGTGTTIVPAAATLTLTGDKQLGRTLRLNRDVTWNAGAGGLFLHPTGVVEAGATLTFADDTDFTGAGLALRSLPGGTIRKSGAGTGTTVPPIDNQGLLEITGGALGTGSVSSPGVIAVSAGAELSGGLVTVRGTGRLGGGGAVRAPVTNHGIVEPAGTLSILQNGYTQTATGTLALDLDGPSDFDKLSVAGAAALAGTLALDPAPAFDPPLDSTLQVVTSASRTGAFGTVTGAGLPGGNSFTVEYPGSPDFGARLRVVNIPQPPPPPAITSTDPASPSNQNTIKVKGLTQVGTSVTIYAGADCAGPPLGTGSAVVFGGAGIEVTVPSNATTTLRATATNGAGSSTCSPGFAFTEDSTPPAAPVLSGTDPASPADDVTPAVEGTAEAGSTVRVWTNATCNGAEAATGTAADLTTGITVTVADDTTTSLSARATDAAGNTSACSAPITYVELPPPSISIDDVAQAEGTTGTTAFAFTVTSDRVAPAGGIQVEYTTADGTAQAPADYVAASGQLTIPAGETATGVTVIVNGDADIEPDETLRVDLSNAAGATIAHSQGVGTITNDDALPQLSITDVAARETHGGITNFVFDVQLDAPARAGGVAFDFVAADGTAASPTDYLPESGHLVIPAGGTSEHVVVRVNGDLDDEGDETFFVDVSGVTGATLVDGRGTGTIQDDDVPVVTFDDVATEESDAGSRAQPMTFRVQLGTPAPPGGAAVDYETVDGTAVAPGDYSARSGRLEIPEGQTAGTISVPILGDRTPEEDETFQVRLGNPSGLLAIDNTATGTIRNDDGPAVTVADGTVREGDSGRTRVGFRVELTDRAPAGGVRLDYTTELRTEGCRSLGFVLCADRDDVPVLSDSVTIAAGSRGATLRIPVRGDQEPEADETFLLRVEVARATIADAEAEGTIVNDDGPRVAIGNLVVFEGDIDRRFVNFPREVTGEVPTGGFLFRHVAEDWEAHDPADYLGNNGFSSEVRVGIRGDRFPERRYKTFFVNLSEARRAVLTDERVRGTIVDDDDDNETPDVVVAGRRQLLDQAVELEAGCDDPCRLRAKGLLLITPDGSRAQASAAGRRFRLRGTSRRLDRGEIRTLRLRVPKAARRRGAGVAKITVRARGTRSVKRVRIRLG